MITLYHLRGSRSDRILWLLEELGLPYALERVEFRPPDKTFFAQATPTGKLPTLVDGETVLCESGAIVEYLVERHGEGRLAPAPGEPERARYLQWLHFAESTAFPPLGILAWLTRYRSDEPALATLVADARERAAHGFEYLAAEFGEGPWLLGESFTAADVMMGFTLGAARMLGALDDRHPALGAYLDRLQTRPAFQRAMAEV